MLTYQRSEHEPTFSVAFDRYDGDRVRYRWTIDLDPQFPGTHRFTGDDLSEAGEANEASALRSLGSFLGAWVEACDAGERDGRDDHENVSLFPIALWNAYAVDWQATLAELDENTRTDR